MDNNPGIWRQENFNAGAEADQAESLALLNSFAFTGPADNSSGNKPSNLHCPDGAAIFGANHDFIAFIFRRCLVQIRRQKFSFVVGNFFNLPGSPDSK